MRAPFSERFALAHHNDDPAERISTWLACPLKSISVLALLQRATLRTSYDYPDMLYMVIETFRNGDPTPVYRRFRDQGRLMPDGVKYLDSWVSNDLRRCFQVMECSDHRLLDEWMANWEDLIEFEVVPVMTSVDAAAAVTA
ncbi:MAG: DUF3303 domain-containing protein [Acidobacteriaceae bacterium]|nr:DUF3303 domain-containing protein [Acidobacteriaceae bacterium]